MTTTLTQAEQVSAELHNDGQTWETDDGRSLPELAQSTGSTHEHRTVGIAQYDVYTWDDGSRIIDAEGGWDLGFPGMDCLCWAGNGHDDDCPHYGTVADTMTQHTDNIYAAHTYAQQWTAGDNDGRGFAIGEDSDDVNGVAAALGATLIERALTNTDVAVYRLADGSLVAVGDSHGPWAVEVTAR